MWSPRTLVIDFCRAMSLGAAVTGDDGVPILHWPAFDAQVPTPSTGALERSASPQAPESLTDTVAVGSDLAGGVHEPLGRYRFDVVADSWWWSDELHAMYGFTPGDVVPTSELLWAHAHPEDRVAATALISTAIAMGGHFSLRHRIIDTRNHVRTVVSLGGAITDAAGTVVAVAGYVVAISGAQHWNAARSIHRTDVGFPERHTTIEQAKGALRATFGCTSDEAFAMLKWRSQCSNIKLHVVADHLMNAPSPSGRDTFAAFNGFITTLSSRQV